MSERILYPLGIIAGWSSGIMAYLNVIKDVVGLIGVVAGTALSLWALWDRYSKWRDARKQK